MAKEVKKATIKAIGKNYIYSKLAHDINFAIYSPLPEKENSNKQRRVLKHILIKGGADVVDIDTRKTAQVIQNIVDDEQLEELKKLSTFNDYIKSGWMYIDTTERTVERAVANLTSERDKSAQKTSSDFPEQIVLLNEKPR